MRLCPSLQSSNCLSPEPLVHWKSSAGAPPPISEESPFCPLGLAKPLKGCKSAQYENSCSNPFVSQRRNPWKAEKSGKVTKVRDRRQKNCVREGNALSCFPITAFPCNSGTPVRICSPRPGIHCGNQPALLETSGLEGMSGAGVGEGLCGQGWLCRA